MNERKNAYVVICTRTEGNTKYIVYPAAADTNRHDEDWTIDNLDGSVSIDLIVHADTADDAIRSAIERVTGARLRDRLKSALLARYGLSL